MSDPWKQRDYLIEQGYSKEMANNLAGVAGVPEPASRTPFGGANRPPDPFDVVMNRKQEAESSYTGPRYGPPPDIQAANAKERSRENAEWDARQAAKRAGVKTDQPPAHATDGGTKPIAILGILGVVLGAGIVIYRAEIGNSPHKPAHDPIPQHAPVGPAHSSVPRHKRSHKHDQIGHRAKPSAIPQGAQQVP